MKINLALHTTNKQVLDAAVKYKVTITVPGPNARQETFLTTAVSEKKAVANAMEQLRIKLNMGRNQFLKIVLGQIVVERT